METGGCAAAPERAVQAEKTPLLTSEQVKSNQQGVTIRFDLPAPLVCLKKTACRLTISCFVFSPGGATRGRLGGEHREAEMVRIHFCRCCRVLLHSQQRWDQVGLDQGKIGGLGVTLATSPGTAQMPPPGISSSSAASSRWPSWLPSCGSPTPPRSVRPTLPRGGDWSPRGS